MLSERNVRILRAASLVILAVLVFTGAYLLWRRAPKTDRPSGPVIEPSGDTQTHEGLTVFTSDYRIVGNQVMAKICFNRPSVGDWQIYTARMEYNDGLEPPQWSLNCYKNMCPPANELGMDCDILSFPVSSGQQVRNFTIRIENIIAVPVEGEFCWPEVLASFQSALDRIHPGIVLDCEHEPWMGGLDIISIPEDMTWEEAEKIVYNADFMVQVRGRKGPWVFKATVRQNGE